MALSIIRIIITAETIIKTDNNSNIGNYNNANSLL